MAKYLMLIGLTLLTSCTTKDQIQEEVLTSLQKQWLSESSLTTKVYMESCMKNNSFSTCFNANNSTNRSENKQTSGTSVGKIAAGVAIGNILTK